MPGVHEKNIPAERVRELLDYDPDTGLLTWRPRVNAVKGWNKKCAGKVAGRIAQGYVRINIGKHKHLGHRLAWAWMTGKWPEHEVDHRNLVRHDNRWKNLRQATHRQNNCNTYLQSNNTSGHKGVTWDKQRLKWRAQIKRHGKMKNLGRFGNYDDAVRVYEDAASESFGIYRRQSEPRPQHGIS